MTDSGVGSAKISEDQSLDNGVFNETVSDNTSTRRPSIVVGSITSVTSSQSEKIDKMYSHSTSHARSENKRLDLKNIIFKYCLYNARVLYMIVITLFADWTQVIRQPVNSFLLFVFIPIINVLFLHLSVLGYLIDNFGGRKIIDKIGKRYFHGLSVINWFNPKLIVDAEALVYDGLKHLGDATNSKKFSIPIAKLLLTLSSIVYEKPSIIFKYAEKWNLTLEMAHINDNKGDGVYIFFSKEQNLMILVFRGTNPLDLNEIHLDATIQKVDATPYGN
jgi:hypothetical protein